MNNSGDDSFAAFVGIDWADAKHDICLLSADSEVSESLVIAHRAEAIEEWALNLQRRFKGQPIAICLELNKGPSSARSASTISSCCFRSIRNRWPAIARYSAAAALKTIPLMHSCNSTCCVNIATG